MRPGTYNLDLYRGDSYAWDFLLWQDVEMTIPVDLTGVTAKAEFRASPGGSEIMTLTCTITVPNTVHVKLPAAGWTGFTVRKGQWDLQLTYTDLSVVTVLAGTVNVVNDITDSVVPTQLTGPATRAARYE
jgi:hypothetical protein